MVAQTDQDPRARLKDAMTTIIEIEALFNHEGKYDKGVEILKEMTVKLLQDLDDEETFDAEDLLSSTQDEVGEAATPPATAADPIVRIVSSPSRKEFPITLLHHGSLD